MNQVQLKLLRLMVMLALSAAHTAHAGTTIYGIRGTATAGANDIIRHDPATGASTLVYDNYPGGNAATIAQCPNGLIYYSIFGGTNQLYVFNPHTPTVAPATLGPGLPDSALRMACSPTGVLYYLTQADRLRIIDTTTGTYTGANVLITGLGLGGDMAFNSAGTLFGFSNTNNLFTIPLGGGAVTAFGTGPVTGLGTNAGIGLAFTDTDAIRILTTGSVGFYSVAGTSPPAATGLGAAQPGGGATGDLASINVPNPDLSITKSANVSSVAYGLASPVVYTIVVTNSSAYPVSSTVTDTFPAAVSGETWTCSASAGSTCVASGSGDINTVATLAAGGTATYTVNATINATASVVNTASVALPFTFLTDATPANNTASNTITVLPRVSKLFGADFGSGGNTSLTITIAYGTSMTTTSVFTDTLPAAPGAMTVNTAGNTGTCPNVTAAAGSSSITMASGTVIPAGGCTIVVNVTATTVGTYTNTIAAGALTTSAGNNPNVATDSVVVTPVPTITKSFSPASIALGGTSTLTITLTNPTGVAMTAATFTDVFPTSPGAMTVAATPPARATTCAGGVLRDSNNNPLGTGDVGVRLNTATIPANGSCTVTLGVTASVAGVYTNDIAVGALTTSGGSNTVAASATLSVGLPSFTVAKTVSVVSDPLNGATLPKAIPGAVVQYSVLVTNSGAGTATNNSTVITDAIPSNTRLFVGNLGGAGSGPIAFVDGTPLSGLTYTFTSLTSGTDDVSFSNTGCTPFTNYVPVPDVDGFDALVTCIRINPKGTFAAAGGGNNPNFEARFRVRVN